MKIAIKVKPLALIQKAMGYGMVIMAVTSNESLGQIAFGVALGILASEMADIWYKLICRCEYAVKKSA